MSYSHIPEGFQTISPYFCVERASAFIDFLQTAFDTEVLYQKTRNDGTIEHALLKIGNSQIELSEAKPVFPARTFACQLFVPNCDAVYKKAIDAGAESIGEPADMVYGVRAGYVKDAWGNQWYISTQIKNRYAPKFWEPLEKFNA
ncbi:N/A [soil metagenome]